MNTKTGLALLFFTILLTFASCNTKQLKDEEAPVYTQRLKGDKGIYGLACDGCNDSVTVLLPENGGDPVTYNSFEAHSRGRVLGKIQIGDRICVIPNAKDSTMVDAVIDIDKLQGIWCYIVMPKMRDYQSMSKKLQERLMNNMSDSLKATFLIPREYGFGLRRDWVALSVGYVDDSNSLADESPVVYPPLGYFTAWHLWNGNLVIVSGTPTIGKDGQFRVVNERNDTCSIDFLGADSLVLSSDGISRSYYRKENIGEINAKARAIADMRKRQALEETRQ